MNIMEYAEELADVCAVADLGRDKKQLTETYGGDICRYPYAVVIGHLMKKDIIDKIPLTYNDNKLAAQYMDEYYDSHQRADGIAQKIAEYIKDKSYNAIVLNVSGKSEELDLKIPFSNKTSANLSGAGWIGKNNLITTEKFGAALTWVTILTDAPLAEYAGNPVKSKCGDCVKCVKACPGGAITDNIDPKVSYDPGICGNYIYSRQDGDHKFACGMCLYICPYRN